MSLTLFLCITLLLPSPCRSDFGVRFNPDNYREFWQYDYEKEDNVKSQTLQFNLSEGEWYYFEKIDRLEFHPDTTGMLIFSKITDSEFIYFEKPKRVLIFPSKKSRKSPYVSESLILNPEYKFNEEDLLFPPIQEGIDVKNAMENLQEGERLPRQEDAKGDGLKLNQTMNANESLVKTIWKDLNTIEKKFAQYNNKMPYFDFVDKDVNFGVGYSNHGSLLLTFQEDVLKHVTSTGQMPTDMAKNEEVRLKYKTVRNEFIWRLFPYMFTKESYFLFVGPRALHEQNILLQKFRPSAGIFLNQIKEDTNILTEEIQGKFDKVGELLVQIVDQLSQDFVFENDQFFTFFFRNFRGYGTIEKLMKSYNNFRKSNMIYGDLHLYHWKVLNPLGYNQDDHNIDQDHRQFTDPDVIKIVNEIKTLLVEIFTAWHNPLSDMVDQLDESMGDPILEQILNQMIKQKLDKTKDYTYTEIMLNSRKSKKFDRKDREANIKAFENLNFHELVYNWLIQIIIGRVLEIYESAFFVDIYSMHALKKMKLIDEKSGGMKPDSQLWFVRNLMIFGLMNYDASLVNDEVRKFKDNLEFFQVKEVDNLTPNIFDSRLLVV